MSTRLFRRRDFMKFSGLGVVSAAASTWAFKKFSTPKANYSFSGSIVGANSKIGHLLRSAIQVRPSSTRTMDTIIVGGGISGLSAGWWLNKSNYKDFLILEMDREVGGNSVSGESSITKYPWGAHYVPLPSSEANYVRTFFEEIGIIQGYQEDQPIYNEYYLCADAHERLFFQGSWREGLVPQYGISADEKRQYEEFFLFVDNLKNKKGSDGKIIFAIPLELSSRDPSYLKWDQISMSEFMKEKNWTSKYLNWYVNYCCRDDYGMPHHKISAWAGLHYFASRAGTARNADSQAVVTWPEGNGFLVDKLRELNGETIIKNSLVFSIEPRDDHNVVDVLNTVDQTCTRYLAKNIIFSSPRYIANKVIKGYFNEIQLDYAPWVVANISLKKKPDSQGAQLSWDNVSFYSKSLGYIVANHQDLKVGHHETVFTYYLPLDDENPNVERMSAFRRTYRDWLDLIVPDLEMMHPGISKLVTNIDIWVWGHGMVSPGIDYLWSSKRKKFVEPFGTIEFAHSDMSGISVFEEAQFRGVEAAKKILAKS